MARARSGAAATRRGSRAVKKRGQPEGEKDSGGSKLRRSGDVPMGRLHCYVPEGLVMRLRVHCAVERQSISDAVSAALAHWLDRAGK